MKNINLVLAGLLFATFAAGCATRQKVMDAALVSMTHTSVPAEAKLKSVGEVKGAFCSSMSNDKGTIGLFDEAVKNAQSTNKVDFIANASFWATGAGCVEVEGTGQRLMSTEGTTRKTR